MCANKRVTQSHDGCIVSPLLHMHAPRSHMPLYEQSAFVWHVELKTIAGARAMAKSSIGAHVQQ